MKKLRNSLIWYTLGVIIYSLNSFLFMVIVTRINGLHDAGIFTYSFALCCLFYFLETYYNRAYQLSKDNKEKVFNDLLSTRVVSSLIGLVIIVLFSIISRFSLFKIGVIVLLYLYRDIEALADTMHGVFHINNELPTSGKAFLLRTLLTNLTLIVVDLLTHNIIISIIGMIIINLLIVWLYDYRKFKKISNFKIKLSFKDNTKKILKESFSIFAFSFLNNMIVNIQRYVLTYYVSADVESIFGMIIMPATIMIILSLSIYNTFLNEFKSYQKDKDYHKMNKLLINIIASLIVIAIVGLIGCYFLGIPVLEFVYGIELDEYKMLLLTIILASLFSSIVSVYSPILTLLGKNTIQLIIHVICVIISLLISWLLIMNNGLSGAVLSYLISLFIFFIMYTIAYIIIIRRLINDKG